MAHVCDSTLIHQRSDEPVGCDLPSGHDDDHFHQLDGRGWVTWANDGQGR